MNWLFIILLLLQLVTCQKDDEVKEILDFLHRGDEQIKSTEHKEIVFVVGPTGTGKSTLVYFLAGNPSLLQSIPSDEEDSDDYIIEHLYEDKIGNVTFQSKTIYPDLVIDENNVPYYDCPGFSDTRKTSIEIATTYFTKKIITQADRLKIVFVVNFNSMIRGTSSRKDFADFMQHATDFLGNVKPYKAAVILVASKVPIMESATTHATTSREGGGEKFTKKIRSFLKEYRQYLIDEADQRTDSKSKDAILNKLDLVDIFYERIILFKRPSSPGLLSRLPDMMENRLALRRSINERLQFVEMNANDFGYTLSDRSKLKIMALAAEINEKITNAFGHLNRLVIDGYSNQTVNFNDIDSMQNELKNGINALNGIFNSGRSQSSLQAAIKALGRLNIANVRSILVDFENLMDYLRFLETVSDAPTDRRTSEWFGALRSCMEYLVQEKNWYTFASTFLLRLSDYEIQSNPTRYNVVGVERWGEGDDDSGIAITEENFAIFLKKVMPIELVNDTVASSSKIGLLNSMLNATLNTRIAVTCHSERMTVKRNFVRLSDLQNYETLCHGHQTVKRRIRLLFEPIADVASIFTGFGAVMGRSVNVIHRVADAFANPKDREEYVVPFEDVTFRATDELSQLENPKKFPRNRKPFLHVIDEILAMAAGHSLADIVKPVKIVRQKLMSGTDIKVDLTSDEMDLLQNNVQNVIEKEVQKTHHHSLNESNSLKALDKIYKKLSLLRLDVDLFDKFSSNDQQLHEIDSALSQSREKLFELKRLERTLEQSIVPMTKQMKELLIALPKELHGKDATKPESSLNFQKWHIRNIFTNIRHQLQQFRSLDWKLDEEFLLLIDKLDGAISTLTNIFDRMQIYGDQVRLSNYIANIESATNYPPMGTSASTEWSEKLTQLNEIIESNVLLTIYGNAINGFKQTVFPFADFYLRRLKLPPQLETEMNFKELVRKATEELVNLKLTLKEYYSASVNPNDNLIHTADFSSDFTSTKPFYIWTTSDGHRDMIANLLSGKSITVKVDIKRAPTKLNAVKFQYLHIRLKSSDRSNQTELDKFLANFDVEIVHHGNSYYRCDDKFYLITSPTRRIAYSMETDPTTCQSIRGNNVYHKMKTGDFVLSPYALLTISLRARLPEQFAILNIDFGQNIDLELTGRGQYLNPNVDACTGLEKYYAADEVLADDL